MTTEKEFWEFAGRYFRTVTSIKHIVDDLRVSGGLSKDVRAIKSMKRVENIMKDFDEQKPQDISIDEGCVGCAGPCKVVDVSANLQKELDTTRDMYQSACDECGKQRKTIEDQKRTINHFINYIGGIEAELSTRKEDSAVLMKVVDVSNRWSDERIASRPAMNQIAYLVKDYHDAPEGPPETPINDANDRLNKIHMLVNTLFDNKVADYATILGNIRGLSDVNDATETPTNDDQDIAIVFTYGEIL